MVSESNILHRFFFGKDSTNFRHWKVTLKLRISKSLTRLFIILVSLTKWKCLFLIDVLVFWCPTWTKNLERSLVDLSFVKIRQVAVSLGQKPSSISFDMLLCRKVARLLPFSDCRGGRKWTKVTKTSSRTSLLDFSPFKKVGDFYSW